jgi:prepilin-type N-terminal cleavage/methylation domain-containing protein
MLTSVRRRSSEAGFTLVELLVVMIILGIVGGITTTAVVTSLHSASNTESRIRALHELETALQRMTRDLRVADPLELSPVATSGDFEAFDTDLGATVFRNGVDEDVRYRLIGDPDDGPQRLVREDTGQTLVTLVDNGGEPVFEYLRFDGRPLQCTGDAELPDVTDIDDCKDRLMRAAQIRIRLVRVIDDSSAPVRAETIIGVRSIRYGG